MEENDGSRRKKTGRLTRYMLITGRQFMHTGWQWPWEHCIHETRRGFNQDKGILDFLSIN